MKPRLVQEQRLEWKMNQSLLQSLQVLQFSSVELIDYIKELSKENPLIEEVDFDYDLSQYKAGHQGDFSVGEINQAEETMYDQLKGQLYTLDVRAELLPIIEFGIDSLNEDGYLGIDMEIWAENCGTTEEEVEEALAKIQQLEPAGIGARTLGECIVLQLKQRETHQPFAEELLADHLVWVAEENKEAIAEHYGVRLEEAEKLLNEIKSCHPKPGHLLETKQPEYIIPEASIYKKDGSWKISFFKWNSPDIEVNDRYMEGTELDKEAAAYLKEKYRQIDWLKQAISYRTNTLEQIIRIIVERQYMYFEHGAYMLRPLTLREIAEEIGVHISTVSRALNNKYVQTGQGVLPLKFFLQSGVRQPDGKQTSAFAVKKMIQELIEHEDKTKPLSDEGIRQKLGGEFGISIARRTIMKYRKQLGIPSSVKRRERRGNG
ncbi:RNA polymerase factor sigma-54 [Virgibacillus xinjiangensis]|uniref:RNA polymerase factor sigma-54 n=1 Tax=Virgibacillus xinjiangensis TaxID=393090 RepID=A0ABV7CXV5_9BACI